MAKEHPIMITVEENGIGGFGSHGEQRSCIISWAPVVHGNFHVNDIF